MTGPLTVTLVRAATARAIEDAIAAECVALITAAEERLAHRHDGWLERERTKAIREHWREVTR